MLRTRTDVTPAFTLERFKAVLAQATGLTTTERLRLIDASFPKDASLRAELVSVLEMHDRATRALSSEVGHEADATTVEAAHPWHRGTNSALLQTGAVYGPYRVIRQLGAGGMGQVFLAEDVRLRRRVALKSLSGTWLESVEARQRLMREARMAAALAHPNIATLYDVLEDGNHLLLVMEYVEGRTLRVAIDQGPLSVGHSVRLAVQIADAVSYAHDRGTIHCDLKPANVQVALDGAPKILDFGLARARWASDDRTAQASGELGVLVGTPAYMAPEWLGRGVLAPSVDIYSLGVIIFELLTGRHPFPEADLSSLVLAVLSAPAPRPSSLRTSVPITLDDVVSRALAKDPTLRYQSARELTRDLEPILSSVEPRTASRLTLAGIWLSVTLVGLLAAGSVTSLAYTLRFGSTSFAEESPLLWPYWGLRSMVLPLAVMVTVAVGWGLLYGMARLCFAVFEPVRRRTAPLHRHLREWAEQLRSTPSGILAQVLFFVNIVAIALFYWRFHDVVEGLENFATQGPMTALAPSHSSHHRAFRMLLSMELFIFGLAWYRLLKTRYERREEGVFSSLAGGMLAIVTICLLAAPYRVLYHNVGERVSYQSQPCYLVGQRSSDALLFCPRQVPPRNRLVRLDDPALVRGQVYESIFAELDRTP
jgi:serine/threonine protein kinase